MTAQLPENLVPAKVKLDDRDFYLWLKTTIDQLLANNFSKFLGITF